MPITCRSSLQVALAPLLLSDGFDGPAMREINRVMDAVDRSLSRQRG